MLKLAYFLAALGSMVVCASGFAIDSTSLQRESQVQSKPVLSTGKKALDQTVLNKPVRDKWALVVGIGDFVNKKIPHLKYATKDARDFYDYLIKEGHFAPDHVRILLNEKATQRRIMSELGSKFLARLAKPDDLIVLFFSTHGSPSQMDLRGKNYIVAYDSEPEDLFATGIEMQKVLESIQGRVLSDRVLLVLDACHSGSANPDAKGMMRVGNFDAQALAEGSGQMVICSSQPDEQSWESKRYDNGVFTRNLLEGLRSTGLNTSLSKAFEATQQLVQDEVREDHPGARQTPVLHSKWSGNELIVAVPPFAPQKIPPTVLSDLEPDSSQVNKNAPQLVFRKEQLSSYPQNSLEKEGSKSSLLLTRSYFSNEANPRAAYGSICEATDVNFNNPDFYYRKAKILIQLENWGKAMQTLKGCIVDDPNQPEYYLARAYCFHKLRMEALSQADIRTARFKCPTLPAVIEFGD